MSLQQPKRRYTLVLVLVLLLLLVHKWYRAAQRSLFSREGRPAADVTGNDGG